VPSSILKVLKICWGTSKCWANADWLSFFDGRVYFTQHGSKWTWMHSYTE